MTTSIETTDLTFRPREIRRNVNRALLPDNKLAREVTDPLFDIGVQAVGLNERVDYAAMPTVIGPPYHSITLMLQGEMTFHFVDHERTLGAGELACCPLGAFHYRAARNRPTWWLYFEIRDCELWESFKGHAAYFRAYESAALMYLLVRDLFDAMNAHTPIALDRGRKSAQALGNLLLHEMVVAGSKPDYRTRELARLMRTIRRHPEQDWSREEMARRLNVSVRQLTRLFEINYGRPPRELVIRQRLNRAAQDLASSHDTLDAIAIRNGYGSVHSFCHQFKKLIGMSPGKYRALLRQNSEETTRR
ncbi:MAG: AraC family transcriptional regulator [Lentisphaeria bacterium]|nr:AraC family transcriptional regulator [Lentisphaeria bacterium]